MKLGFLSLALLATACFSPSSASYAQAAAPKPRIAVPVRLPPEELGQAVALGRDIVNQTNTHPLSKAYVGNALTCSSCHADAGTRPEALSFFGVASAYPTYAAREDEVITLEDRNLNCFMRSMNGIRPPNGGELSVALAAYITWLSEGYPIKMSLNGPFGPNAMPALKIDPKTADPARGKSLYAQRCAACHGADGAGVGKFPPVWGAKSYNGGAGMAQNPKLASYIKFAMSQGDPNLSARDALDIAAFVNSNPRPRFVLEEHLPKK